MEPSAKFFQKMFVSKRWLIYRKLKLLLLLLYDPSAKREYQLVGHVSYEEDSRITSSINPLPCGLGLMNIAMLLSTTLQSTKRAYGFN